jgi:hypothetical protein
VSKKTKREKDFLCGTAWALGVLSNGFGQPNLAAMIANEGNLSTKDFDGAGAESSDVDYFRADLDRLTRRTAAKRAVKEEPPDIVECVECGAETADPGVGVRCEADNADGQRCGGRLEKKAA